MMIAPNPWESFERSVLLKRENEEIAKYIRQTIEQIRSSFELQIQQILRELREKGIVLQHIDDIHEYLLRFPDIIDVLPFAISVLGKYFPEARIILDMYKDPEIEDSYLVIYVRTENYDESFIDKLGKAESEFLDSLVNKEGWIQVSTDFRLKDEEDEI